MGQSEIHGPFAQEECRIPPVHTLCIQSTQGPCTVIQFSHVHCSLCSLARAEEGDRGRGYQQRRRDRGEYQQRRWDRGGGISRGRGTGKGGEASVEEGEPGRVGRASVEEGGAGRVGRASVEEGGAGRVGRASVEEGEPGRVRRASVEEGEPGRVGRASVEEVGPGRVGRASAEEGEPGRVRRASVEEGEPGRVGRASAEEGERGGEYQQRCCVDWGPRQPAHGDYVRRGRCRAHGAINDFRPAQSSRYSSDTALLQMPS